MIINYKNDSYKMLKYLLKMNQNKIKIGKLKLLFLSLRLSDLKTNIIFEKLLKAITKTLDN